jgi:hypothetical protein
VHKGSTQTNKRSKLGFKRKEQKKPKRTLVWRIGLSGVPLDSVRRTRGDRLQLFTFGFLRPRSAIIHRTVPCATGLSGAPAKQRLASATVDSNGRLQREQWRTVRAEERAAARGTPDSAQYLSGTAPDCPVPPEDKAPTIETVRTLTVRWRGWRTGHYSMAHRTVRCAHRHLPAPTVELVVEGYKYPQPPPLQPSKHSQQCIQYKSNTLHSKTQIKASDPIKVHNSTLVF